MCGVVLKEERAAVLSMCSVKGDSWLGIPLNRNDKNVTCDINRAFVYAQVLGEGRTFVRIVINSDPHMDYVP